MRSAFYFLFLVAMSCSIYSCLYVSVDRDNMAHIVLKEKGFNVDVDYVAVGATSQDVTQITKVYSDGKSEVLDNIRPHEHLLNYHLDGDSILILVFVDTVGMSVKVDTVGVKL